MDNNMYNTMRLWFIDVSHSVKLSYYCYQLGIKPANLTHFLKGNNGSVSYDKLVQLRDFIIEDLNKKIA